MLNLAVESRDFLLRRSAVRDQRCSSDSFLTGLELSPYAMVLADISQQAKIPIVIMNAGAARSHKRWRGAP